MSHGFHRHGAIGIYPLAEAGWVEACGGQRHAVWWASLRSTHPASSFDFETAFQRSALFD